MLNWDSSEIKQLEATYAGLIDQLKNVSKQVDEKMKKMKAFKRHVNHSASPSMMTNETECLEKLKKVYQTEVQNLKERIVEKTGVDKFMDLGQKIATNKETYDQLLVEKLELEKQIKINGKILNKEDIKLERGITQVEVSIAL